MKENCSTGYQRRLQEKKQEHRWQNRMKEWLKQNNLKSKSFEKYFYLASPKKRKAPSDGNPLR